jgi:ABC-type polysaccharide/polyol phosphate transport system ATPase subunit
MTPAITLSHVTKVYRRFSRRHFATLKSALLQRSILRDLKPDQTFTALSDVSFEVATGSTFGLVGRNGSGKSTALKLVAGITKPTSGTVDVRGRVSALIELGAGFHPEISGRENVYINGMMLGMSKREIEKRFDEIVEFAELTDFIDEPVKTYSSGMYMRLGFSVAIHVDPDVLLVDEVLAVGDEGFTHKCLDKFADFKKRGKTILLVTHSLNLVERFCDDAAWLDGGRVNGRGDPKRVVDAYVADVARLENEFLTAADKRLRHDTATEPPPAAAEPTVPDRTMPAEGRWGSGGIEIAEVALLDRRGEPTHVFQSGDPLRLRMKIRAHRAVDDFVFGVAIFNAEGMCVYGTNTEIEKFEPIRLEGDSEVALDFDALDLAEGTYKIDVAVHTRDGAPYDFHRQLYTFRIKSPVKEVGVYRPRHHWTFSGPVRFKTEPQV